MIVVQPKVYLDSDTRDCAQARHGLLVAFGRARSVWCFGFAMGSGLALAFNTYSELALWVLAVHQGTVLQTFHGPFESPDLPAQFCNVMRAEL